jgi:hypothetical protein
MKSLPYFSSSQSLWAELVIKVKSFFSLLFLVFPLFYPNYKEQEEESSITLRSLFLTGRIFPFSARDAKGMRFLTWFVCCISKMSNRVCNFMGKRKDESAFIFYVCSFWGDEISNFINIYLRLKCKCTFLRSNNFLILLKVQQRVKIINIQFFTDNNRFQMVSSLVGIATSC